MTVGEISFHLGIRLAAIFCHRISLVNFSAWPPLLIDTLAMSATGRSYFASTSAGEANGSGKSVLSWMLVSPVPDTL